MNRLYTIFALLFLSYQVSAVSYCIPSVTSTTVVGSGITNISFNTLNCTTPAQQGYIDSTELSTTVGRTGTYTFFITPGSTSFPSRFFVWIDWNQDGVFGNAASGEMPWSSTSINISNTFSISITIPANATLGTTRMRVMCKKTAGGLAPNSCGTIANGDVEDYTINVVDLPMQFDSTFYFRQYLGESKSGIYPLKFLYPNPCTVNTEIMGICAKTSFQGSPLQCDSIRFTINSPTQLSDIKNARLWYTANVDTFNTTLQVGNTINVIGNTFTIKGILTALQPNNNFFWLTFDIPCTAQTGEIKAQCDSLWINTSVYPVKSSVSCFYPPNRSVFIDKPSNYPNKCYNMWYFGSTLDFNAGTFAPSLLTVGNGLGSDEGTASISDSNGQLLFYSDGKNIWDKNQNMMPNANGSIPADWDKMLGGHYSSTQSVMIIPVPGSTTRFYVFTVDGYSSWGFGPKGAWDGLNYTVVDMSLNGGLGDIDVAYINGLGQAGNKIFLVDSINENQTAAIHANGSDFWIISYRHVNSSFYAFHVSCSGVDPTPVITPVPGIDALSGSVGNMGPRFIKSSLDGKSIVMGTLLLGQIFDFDNCTGRFSGMRQFSSDYVSTSISFSPNDSFIYCGGNRGIARYERYAPNILATETFLTNGVISANMQLAPNGKIYMGGFSLDNCGTLNIAGGVINNPDDINNPDLEPLKFFLGGGPSVALPYCFDHLLFPRKIPFSGNDTIVCAGNSVSLGRNSICGLSYSWEPATGLSSPSVSNPLITASTTTSYIVKAFTACNDTLYDTIAVVVNTLPHAAITATTSICVGDITTINAAGGVKYFWSNSSTTSSITVSPSTSTTFSLSLTDINGCKRDTSVTINVTSTSIAGIANDTSICAGATITFQSSSMGTYIWSTGESTSSISVSPSILTTYSVTISSGACIGTDEVIVSVVPVPTAIVGNDTTITIGKSITLNGSAANNHIWIPSTGLSCTTCQSTIASPVQTTKYCLVVFNTLQCADTTCITVTVDTDCDDLFVPNVFSPNGDGENDMLRIYGSCIETMQLTIYDRWGEKVFESQNINDFWDGKQKGKELNSTIFAYVFQANLISKKTVEKKGCISLIK